MRHSTKLLPLFVFLIPFTIAISATADVPETPPRIPQKYFSGLFSSSSETRLETLQNAREDYRLQIQEQNDRIQELIDILRRPNVDRSFGGPAFCAIQLLGEYHASAGIYAITNWLTYLPELPPRTYLTLTTEQEKYPAVRALMRINDAKSTFPWLDDIIAESSEPLKRELAGYVLAKLLGREETVIKLENASKTASKKSKTNYQQTIKFVKTVRLRPQLPRITAPNFNLREKSTFPNQKNSAPQN